MIDRPARDKLILAFEDYLGDKITAFEFDDRLQEIASEDRTVNEVVHAAWFHYDDCKDHKVHLSKSEWDFFQRLLLILRSDAELYARLSKRWSWDHAIAWLAFAFFIGITITIGWGWHLIMWTTPFGVVSILISMYRRRGEPEYTPTEVARVPFETIPQIRRLRNEVPAFEKRRYRAEIRGRKIRSDTEDSFNWVFSHCYWFVFSPLVLLFQGFPTTTSHPLKLTKP